MKYLQKTGFFAFCVGLCGLLLGLTGCASVKNVMKKTSAAFSGVLKQSAQQSTPKKRRGDAKKRDGKKASELVEFFPRQAEAQYLARLDSDRQIIMDMNNAEGVDAKYHAIRPEARNVRDSNFDSSTYAVDLDAGTVEILETAYEAEPFTGTVIVKHPNNEQRLVAYISQGIMAETGSLWDLNGTKRLRNKYDENGTLRESSNFDVNGTLRLSNIYDENGTLSEDRIYYEDGITVRRQNKFGEDGILTASNFFDENGKPVPGSLPEGTILASRTRVGGEFIFDLDDPNEFPFPFTGTMVEFYDEERKIKKREEPVNLGKHHGTVTWWYKNGTKQFEAKYVKGEPQGITKWYREDGSVEYEGEWQDNKLVRATTWTANDQENGHVIDGAGTLIYLHPNGQKRLEETYTDSKLTATQWWDDQGNAVESVDPSFIPPIPRIK